METFYDKPSNPENYHRWFDNKKTYDIWYTQVTHLYDYRNKDIPEELVAFLDKWSTRFEEYKKDYVEVYPVKLAEITFIYKDFIYSIHPSTVSATYRTNFGEGEEYYEIGWHSLFEEFQRAIRDDMEKELGIIHSKYNGFLD